MRDRFVPNTFDLALGTGFPKPKHARAAKALWNVFRFVEGLKVLERSLGRRGDLGMTAHED